MASYSDKLKHPLWKAKRFEIISRDNGICQSCGIVEDSMDVHHEYYISGKEPWEYPNEALVTLCRSCHTVEETGRKLAYSNLNEAIADAGFTREDIEKLTWAFKNMSVKPIYSHLLMSLIYRELTDCWYSFVKDHGHEIDGIPSLENLFNQHLPDPEF